MATPKAADTASRSYSAHKSLCKLYTPTTQRGIAKKTPRSKRVIASARRNDVNDEVVDHSWKELLGKQWYIYSLSPLYNFKHSPEMFKRYARSLDMAFAQALGKTSGAKDCETRSSIDIFPGLSFHPDDLESVRFQVTEKNNLDGKDSVILRAVLLCVDVEKSMFSSHLPHFSYYPVIIVSGNKLKRDVLLEWLEQHFDCRSSPLTFSHSDLQWLLAVGCSQMNCTKKVDVLLQFDTSKACSGINLMNCTFEFDFCKELWNRLNASSQSREVITEDEVNKFYVSLEQHLEYTMHIYVTKLTLSEVGSPMAYVSAKGKFKMFTHNSIYLTLHLICDIASEKFTQFYQS